MSNQLLKTESPSTRTTSFEKRERGPESFKRLVRALTFASDQDLQEDEPKITFPQKVVTWAGSTFVIFLAVFCVIGALSTSFSITGLGGESLALLLAATMIVVSVCHWRFKGLLASALLALIVFFFYLPGAFRGALHAVSVISEEYSKWTPVPFLFKGAQASAGEQQLFWIVLGVVLILLLALALCIRRSLALTLIITLPFVLPTLLIINFEPDPAFPICLVAVYLCLLMSFALHPKEKLRRSLSVFPSLALIMVLLGGTLLIAPQSNYRENSQIIALYEDLRRVVLGLESESDPWLNRFGAWSFGGGQISVADAGERVIEDVSLLEVASSVPGTFYLRGFSLAEFDGRTWNRSYGEAFFQYAVPGEAVSPETIALLPQQSVSGLWSDLPDGATVIWTRESGLEAPLFVREGDEVIWLFDPVFGPLSDFPDGYFARIGDSEFWYDNAGMAYEPVSFSTLPALIAERYAELYPASAPALAHMSIRPTGDISTLDYYPYFSRNNILSMHNFRFGHTTNADFYPLGNNVFRIAGALSPEDLGIDTRFSSPSVDPFFTSVDPATAAGLREIALAAGIDGSGDRAQIVDRVATLVSSSATYTLKPPRIPEGADFALYFLQNSRAGYCIHFATAATLMLRSLGIPARITIGFVATISEDEVGQSIMVTDRSAHAWVEVYYQNIGWIPLEVTPAAEGSGIPERWYHSPAGAAQAEEARRSSERIRDAAQQSGFDLFNGKVLVVIAISAAVILVFLLVFLVIYSHFARRSRVSHFAGQDTNAAVLYAWRYITRLERSAYLRPEQDIDFHPGRNTGVHRGQDIDPRRGQVAFPGSASAHPAPAGESANKEPSYERGRKCIEDIAQKARFSNHLITPEELEEVVNYALALAKTTYRRSGQLERLSMKYLNFLY